MRILRTVGWTVGLLMIATVAVAQPLTFRVTVDGLECPLCAFGLEKEINKIEGVADLDLDLEAGVILVTMEDGFILDSTTLEAAIETAQARVREAADIAGFSLDGIALVEN